VFDPLTPITVAVGDYENVLELTIDEATQLSAYLTEAVAKAGE
jgi:hypothetical protein